MSNTSRLTCLLFHRHRWAIFVSDQKQKLCGLGRDVEKKSADSRANTIESLDNQVMFFVWYIFQPSHTLASVVHKLVIYCTTDEMVWGVRPTRLAAYEELWARMTEYVPISTEYIFVGFTMLASLAYRRMNAVRGRKRRHGGSRQVYYKLAWIV